ncbi:hypothetical protein F5X68DRAFT_258570 [Plectosphaerella plurivora]|uniref:Uncharacterized protein n=1 Tax=Plectosphaerella plurivora TaxID=936078 RepID=A0A9P9AGI5_9PEZI|nr:hypothetical protein F5X68DRAFT_258570 [Plectosphaerella plurivora]
MRAWVPRPWAAARVQAAHFHTTRPSCLLLNSGHIRIKRKKPLKPLPLPENWEPFKISETLLDLDAYEAQGVREFDEMDEAQQKEKWSKSLARNRLTKQVNRAAPKFEKAHMHYDRLHKREHTSGKWRVTDMDILGAALFYPTAEATSRIEDSMAELKTDGSIAPDLHLLLSKNGIPSLAQAGPSQMMEWLIKRHRDIPPFENTGNVDKRIRQGQNSPYLSWRRYIIHLLRPGTNGLEAIQLYHDSVAHAFRAHFLNKRMRDLLILLGNIRVRLEQEKMKIPHSLSPVGLVMASALGNQKAMQSYLHVILVNHFNIVSPDLSLYDLTEFPSVVVKGFDGEVLFKDTEDTIYELVKQQALRNGDLLAKPKLESKTDQGQDPKDEMTSSDFKL